MHEVGLNTAQLAMSIEQLDDAVELARAWCDRLLDATEAHGMDRTTTALAGARDALAEARASLEGHQDAIEADHNSYGTIRLV